MKKKLLITALFIGIAYGAISLLYSPSHVVKDKDLKQFLNEAGFVKVPSLKSFSIDKEKNYWLSKYGLYFISYQEMDTLCNNNGFIIAPAERFIEEIPDIAARQMKSNYEKIDDDILKFGFRGWASISDYGFWFSDNEVGWVVRNSDDDDSYEYHFVREDLKHRLTTKGVKVLNEFYNTFSYPRWEKGEDNRFQKIFVVADPRKFDTKGMVLNGVLLEYPKPDPIAVIKHRAGYVILTKW